MNAGKIPHYIFGELINFLMIGKSKSVTKYWRNNLIVRAVRRTYHGKIVRGNTEIHLTIGKPNWKERQFIKDCKKAGETFPIRKIQIKELKKK